MNERSSLLERERYGACDDSHGVAIHHAQEGQGTQDQGDAGEDAEQLRLAPTAHLQVMVQRGHAEEALAAGLFEIDHLNNIR